MDTHTAVVERHICGERNVLLARADFAGLLAAYLAHTRTWVGDPDGLILMMMKQALAAAGLYLTCRPRDENTAWTFNFPEPPLNIFAACDASSDRIVGRYYTENVKAEPETRLIVQAVRRTGEPQLSIIAVKGFDILDIFEQYYDQSEQLPVRFFELGGDCYSMVMALPDADESWLREVSRDEALRVLEEPTTRRIEQRAIRFACSCTLERIVGVMAQMFGQRIEELFGEDSQVEVHCPQCGRSYELTRQRLAAQAAGEDPARDPAQDPAGDEQPPGVV